MNRSERVLLFLDAHPGRWIASTEFEKLGGRCGWRTALSEARVALRPRGGDIENRIRKMQGGWLLSEYRYLPPQGQATLFEGTR